MVALGEFNVECAKAILKQYEYIWYNYEYEENEL